MRRGAGRFTMSTMSIATLVMIVLGMVLVLRAAAIVAAGGTGRFRFDPLVTTLLGFALLLLGVALVP